MEQRDLIGLEVKREGVLRRLWNAGPRFLEPAGPWWETTWYAVVLGSSAIVAHAAKGHAIGWDVFVLVSGVAIAVVRYYVKRHEVRAPEEDSETRLPWWLRDGVFVVGGVALLATGDPAHSPGTLVAGLAAAAYGTCTLIPHLSTVIARRWRRVHGGTEGDPFGRS